MSKPVKIAGKIFFPRWMAEFNVHFNPDNKRYECTVGGISDAAQSKLQSELNIKPKVHKDDDIGNYLVAKSTYLFKPVDEDGNEIDVKTLGSGTEVIVIVDSYAHKMSKMHGNAPSIKKLIVTKLVPYEAAERMEQEVEFDDVL
jgi:hypothetical protein